MGQKELSVALACCRPRLLAELPKERTGVILSLGKAALQQLAKPRQLIFNWQGGPLDSLPEIGSYLVIPALHPAFCLREDGRQWMPVMMTHMQRAWAFATGALKRWEWPPYELDVTPKALEYLHELGRPGQEVAFDVETQGIDPLTNKIIAVGIASEKCGVSLPWDEYFNRQLGSVPGLMADKLGAKAKSLVTQILTSRRVSKVAHNGSYDTLSLKHMGGIEVRNFTFDTLLAHAVVSPPLRHRLNDVECVYTHAPRHKDDFKASKDEKGANRFANADPHKLRDYNVKDCFGTIFSKRGLEKHLDRTFKGREQLAALMLRTRIATKMQGRGIPIDLGKFDGHILSIRTLRRYPLNLLKRLAFRLEVVTQKKQKLAGAWLKKGKARRAVTGLAPWLYASRQLNIKTYNPRSHHDVTHFFGELLHAPTFKKSKKTGQPSYGERTMHELIAHPDAVIAYSAGLHLRFRAWDKLLGYFLKRNINGVPVGTGIAHSTHKSYGTRTGRWSGPLLVIPKPGQLSIGKKILKTPGLRDIFVPFPDNVMVEADYKSLEAHIMALFAGDEEWLEILNKGGDVHADTAKKIFGDKYDPKNKKQRAVGKTGNYAVQYGVGVDKLHGTLQGVIPGISISDVIRLRKAIERPAISAYLKRALSQAWRDDFIEEPLSGLRYYFYGKVKETHVYNNRVQMFAASLINLAILGVDKDLDWPHEGILLQIHDALLVDGADAKKLGRVLQSRMAQEVTLGSWTANFLVDMKAGKNYGEGMEKLVL